MSHEQTNREAAHEGYISRMRAIEGPDTDDLMCQTCQGDGFVTDPDDTNAERCPDCDGTGERERTEEDEAPEPLSIDRRIEIDICLSTGGPADGFKLTYDTDGELRSGVYYYAPWYGYEEIQLTTSEAEQVADTYGIYVEPESR
jgi:hypothetical protein